MFVHWKQTLLQWGYELRISIRWHPKCQAGQEHPFLSSLQWITRLRKKSTFSKGPNQKCWTGEGLFQAGRGKTEKQFYPPFCQKFPLDFLLTRANYFQWSSSALLASAHILIPLSHAQACWGRCAGKMHPAARGCAGGAGLLLQRSWGRSNISP